jgi:hypothetical protein
MISYRNDWINQWSRTGTKIRVSNGKKTYKYPGTYHLLTVMNCEGQGTTRSRGISDSLPYLKMC